jgi:hypothetical protein
MLGRGHTYWYTARPMQPPDPPAAMTGVSAGLQLIEALVRLEIARLRASGVPAGQDEYRGLYISDEEVDQLLGASAPPADAPPPGLDAGFAVARAGLLELSRAAPGRLGDLIRLAGLDAFETGCLLLALAPEADLRFERLFAYVQDDVTKRRPRVELAFRLLEGLAPSAHMRSSLAAGTLRSLHLVALHGEAGQIAPPLPAQHLVLSARIAGYLLGENSVDEALRPYADLAAGAPDSLPAVSADLGARLARFATLPPTDLRPPVLHIASRDPNAALPAAATLIAETGLALLSVHLAGAAAALGLDAALTLAEREAALQGAALVLTDAHALKPEEADSLRARLEQPRLAALVLLVSDGRFQWPGLTITLPDPDYESRRWLWARGLGAEVRGIPPDGLERLADKFRLNARQITDAVQTARASAVWREPRAPVVSLEDLYAAARTQSTPILSSLAQKITPHYDWDDIILPPDTVAQLHEICAHMEHRHTVFQTWGFARKLALGTGLMSLFAGQSGTGKTMAADIIAGALGLDLYKIDLSGVISKYIGETEKNLNRIFAEAETSNAILFFDEADALFGKRSEVKDAHDRYANIETAYLLQKMEEYDGVVILATNLKMNLDEAFLRRMHFVVEFPLPDEADRRRIWSGALPAELPVAPDLDLDFLARKFKITGGHIRNIVLSAAFLAAADGRTVTMSHLMQATRREFQKIGRMITPNDFETYYEQFEL